MTTKPIRYYLNQDANGALCVSKKPMNQTFYSTPQILHCVPTTRTKITRQGVFVGAICVTINNEILEIVKIKDRKDY
jgi:hypothetical protein